jgi:hypothetical protein
MVNKFTPKSVIAVNQPKKQSIIHVHAAEFLDRLKD